MLLAISKDVQLRSRLTIVDQQQPRSGMVCGTVRGVFRTAFSVGRMPVALRIEAGKTASETIVWTCNTTPQPGRSGDARVMLLRSDEFEDAPDDRVVWIAPNAAGRTRLEHLASFDASATVRIVDTRRPQTRLASTPLTTWLKTGADIPSARNDSPFQVSVEVVSGADQLLACGFRWVSSHDCSSVSFIVSESTPNPIALDIRHVDVRLSRVRPTGPTTSEIDDDVVFLVNPTGDLEPTATCDRVGDSSRPLGPPFELITPLHFSRRNERCASALGDDLPLQPVRFKSGGTMQSQFGKMSLVLRLSDAEGKPLRLYGGSWSLSCFMLFESS